MIAGAAALGIMLLSGCTPTPDELVQEGISQFQLGHLERAEANIKQALDRRPSHPLGLFYMGRLYHAQKFYVMAIYYYQAAYDADPSLTEAMHFLEQAKQEAGAAGQRLQFIPDPPPNPPPPRHPTTQPM